MIIDTHAHLDFPDYTSDLFDVLSNASDCGIGAIINVGVDIESSKKSLELKDRVNREKGYPKMFASVGIHPNKASEISEKKFSELEELISKNSITAIGETGLDYYRDYSTPADQQRLFRKHIELAIKSHHPIIVHSREANDDCVKILKEYADRNLKGVIHCFSADRTYAKKYLDLGFYISFTGVITYSSANSLRDALKYVPTDRLLLETDSPFLAPQKKRGKRNEPSFLQYVVPFIAELCNLSSEDIERVTSVNANDLFFLNVVKRSAKIAYMIRNSLYLNLTNRCTSRCGFCERETKPYVKGHYLKLEKEPTVEELIDAIGEFKEYDEVVFCGFGEPTLRFEVLKQIAIYLKSKGAKVRLDTNGLGDLINGKPICNELEGLIDKICISLNSNRQEQYDEICVPQFGAKSYPALIDFIKNAKNTIDNVIISVVDMPEIDVEACRKIADELGVNFRLRKYNDTGYKND